MTATPRCEGCHRRLKQPSPSGYGPKGAKKLAGSPPGARAAPQGPGVPPSLSRRLTATHTHLPHPGQTELPLEET